MPLALVTGGVRSGKSELAERLVAEAGLPVRYVATGSPADSEMAERIALHRARRPDGWETVETGDPPAALADAAGRALLLDSLGGWVAGLMEEHGLICEDEVAPLGDDGRRACTALLGTVERFAAAAAARPEPTVVVAEEVGLGLVPEGAASRRFLDLAGEAAQLVAAAATRALFVVAGRALQLASPPPVVARDLGGHAAPVVAPEVHVYGDELGGHAAPVVAPELRFHGDELGGHAVSVVEEERPAWLERALAVGVRDSGAYPDERAARAAVARRHGRPPEEVVLTNGANEAFWLLAAALRPRRAVCVHPSYTEPEAALRAHAIAVERCFRGPGFALDPDAVPAGADLVVTGNPNNPSGTLDRAAVVAALAREGRTLVVDEAFMELVPGEPESLAGRRDVPGLVVVRSITKLWSLPGVRAGYLLAPAPLVRAIERVRPSWNVSSVALHALSECAARPAEARERAERVARGRERLEDGLHRIPALETWPSVVNFVLARARDGGRLAARLLERGIAVRPCGSFPGLDAGHFRMAVRSPDANARLLGALREVTT